MSLQNQPKVRSMRPGYIVLFFALLTTLVITVLYVQKQVQTNSNASQGTTTKKIIGYIAPWDKTRAMQSIQNNYDVISELSPVAYTLTTNGSVILDASGGAELVDDATIADLRAKNIKIIPAIHNVVNGTWNGGNIVTNIINNSSARTTHINNIVNLVVTKGYDGIDIDYENLNASDRTNYTTFLTALATALHAQGKVLATDVYGKTSEPGSWNGPQAQDLQAIGAAADEVRVMIYDYNPSSIGPITPYSWISSVLSFTKTKVPAAKIIHGVPLYGYDWTGSGGTPTDHVWTESTAIAQQYNATQQWDNTNKVPWFSYAASSQKHTVYFENGQSAAAKFDLTNSYGVGGISFWRLGGEDPAVWTSVRTKFALVATPTTAGVPTVIPSPTAATIPTSTPIPSPTSVTTATYSIYADALTAGWINNSYYATVNFANTSPVYQGARSISFTSNKGWAGLTFKSSAGFNTTGYNFLSFVIRTTKANQNLAVYAEDTSYKLLKSVSLSNYGGIPSANSWQIYTIPLTALGSNARIVGAFTIQNNTSLSQPVFYIDQVQLVK